MVEISLNASMRGNLLSLQQTQKLQDITQMRLSTGLKVNSAIDNPASYYTASSLNNRARDLGALLDAMTQGIQTIKAANEVLETATAMLQQAKAIAVKMNASSVDVVAKVRNEAELLAAVEKGGQGYIIIENDINLTNEVQLKDGQKLVGDNYFAEYNGANRKLSFDFTDKKSHGITLGNGGVVSNLDIDYKTDQNYEFGVIKIANVKDTIISNINVSATANNMVSAEAALFMIKESNVSFNGIVNIDSKINHTGFGITSSKSAIDINGTLNAKTSGKKSYGIYSISSELNLNKHSNVNIETTGLTGVGLLTYNVSTTNIYGKLNIKTQQGTAMSNGMNIGSRAACTTNIFSSARVHLEAGGTNALFLNGLHNSTLFANTLFIQNGAEIGGKDNYETFFSKAQKDVGAINDSQNAPQYLKSDYFSDITNFTAISPWTPFDFSTMIANQTFTGNAEIEDKKPDSKSYNEIINQYEQLIKDATYKGINILTENNLKVNFNEERSSGVDIKGVDASAKGIGIQNKVWETQMDVLNSIDELEEGVNKLRSYSAEFGSHYAIVTSREDFTQNLINVLTEGADKLTLADMNAESANMLALQTRQQLAINSLSLASRAAQSVLKLF